MGGGEIEKVFAQLVDGLAEAGFGDGVAWRGMWWREREEKEIDIGEIDWRGRSRSEKIRFCRGIFANVCQCGTMWRAISASEAGVACLGP